MTRAADELRDSAAELVDRRCGDGSAARRVAASIETFSALQLAGECRFDDRRPDRLVAWIPRWATSPNRDRRSEEPLLTSTEPSRACVESRQTVESAAAGAFALNSDRVTAVGATLPLTLGSAKACSPP